MILKSFLLDIEQYVELKMSVLYLPQRASLARVGSHMKAYTFGQNYQWCF